MMASDDFPAFSLAARMNRNEEYDRLAGIARECAYALHAKYDAPPRLIYTAILGVLTAAIGPLYTFKAPGWEPHPISSWTWMSFKSGSGKTSIYGELAKPFHEFAKEQRLRHAENLEAHYVRLDQWELEKSLLEHQLKRKTIKKVERALKAEIDELRKQKPKHPKERPLVIKDFDHESLMAVLDGLDEAVAIIPNEADSLICGRWLSNQVSNLNDIHDGIDPPQHRREKKAALTAENPFLSMNLFTRPGTTERFRATYKNGKVVKSRFVDLGFLARFRIAIDDGAWKSQLYCPQDPDACIEALQILLKSYLELKRQNLESGHFGRVELELERQAIPFWKRIVHKVKVARANEWAVIDEFGGKALVHTGSLAAAIHVPESESPLVSLSALERAWDLACGYAVQYAEALAPPPPPASTIQKDAMRVEEYLRSQYGFIDYRRVDLEHMAHMLDIPLRRIKAVAHHFVHYGLASFCANTRHAMIDVTPMMASTRHITHR